jgi:hypothetical protein
MKQDHHAFALACLILAILLGCLYWIATPARSQTAPQSLCGPTPNIIAMLFSKYGERPGIAGLTDNNIPVLIFTNPKTGTFTITIRRPGNMSCLMTSGTSWTPIEQPKEGVDL